MNEPIVQCSRSTHALGTLHLDAEGYTDPFINITKENGFELFLPTKTIPANSLLDFIDAHLISRADEPLTSLYLDTVFLVDNRMQVGSENTRRFVTELEAVVRETMDEFGMRGTLDPSVFLAHKVPRETDTGVVHDERDL